MPLLIDPPPADEPRYERSSDGTWVIVSSARLARPLPDRLSSLSGPTICPFCEGNESTTPREVFALRNSTAADTPGWRVRVVPNLYPGVVTTVNGTERDNENSCGGYGRHEVIIERPDHDADILDLPSPHFGNVIEVYQERIKALADDQRIECGVLFKNSGRFAGASQEHVHSQLMGLAILPEHVKKILSHESQVPALLKGHPTVVVNSDHFIAYCPEPSFFPFEVWIAPKDREPDFRNAPPAQFVELSKVMRNILRTLSRMITPLAYNTFLHTAAFDGKKRPFDRWHLKVTPRMETLAGCELGAGIYMNPIRPSWAAEQYRKILPQVADEE